MLRRGVIIYSGGGLELMQVSAKGSARDSNPQPEDNRGLSVLVLLPPHHRAAGVDRPHLWQHLSIKLTFKSLVFINSICNFICLKLREEGEGKVRATEEGEMERQENRGRVREKGRGRERDKEKKKWGEERWG